MAIVNPRQIWRGTTAEAATITGASGLIGYDTTLKTFVAFDGVTVGGTVMQNAKLSLIPSDLTNSEKNTICRKINAIPVGAEMAWGSDTIPYGWLVEDGLTTYDVVANPELTLLYNWLNTNGYTNCIVDATHFKTHDWRNAMAKGKGTSSSSDFITLQLDAAPDFSFAKTQTQMQVGGGKYYVPGAVQSDYARNQSAVYGRATEVRVKNYARNFIIKW